MTNLDWKAICLVLGVMVWAGSVKASSEMLPQTEPNRADIEAVIEEYLLTHPEVLERALDNMQAWRTDLQKQEEEAALEPVWEILTTDPSYPRSGPEDAPVTVIEFFDYHCGYCKLAFNTIKEFAQKDWANVRTIYVEFPILREESTNAARAALAAAEQGKYREIHAAFMGAREVISDEMIAETASSIGLDVDQLLSDMKSAQIQQIIDRNHELAAKIGASGTPLFLINKTKVSGADMARIQELVKAGLKGDAK